MIHGASYADVYGAHAGGAAPDGRRASSAPALAVVAGVRRRATGRFRPPSALYLARLDRRRGLQHACCSASSSRPTSRRARRRSSSTTSTPRAGRSRSTASRSAQLSGDALLTRDDIDAQRRDARERPALGSPAAARDVRADPGDPHLLRLRVGRQRPLPHRRRAAAGHAVGARAELGQPAEPHLGQRAADVHARLRPDARAGEPGHERRAAGAVRPRPAAGDDAGSEDRRAEHLFRRAVQRLRHRPDRARASSTTRAATTTSSRSTTAAAACRSGRSGGSCCSRCGSAPTRSC